jgi:endonuclease/exonuclease/phosphatase family metal-dependent hydrolase
MINGFQIIGTHLDVYDNTEITRCTQMDIIMKHINSANAIILGDLNSLRIEDYSPKEWNEILQIDKNRGIVTKTDLVKKIEKNGFIDSFVFSEKIPPKITVWSGRRVDYIFIKTNKKIKIETDIVKTVCSDHYPIYVDLPKKID